MRKKHTFGKRKTGNVFEIVPMITSMTKDTRLYPNALLAVQCFMILQLID